MDPKTRETASKRSHFKSGTNKFVLLSIAYTSESFYCIFVILVPRFIKTFIAFYKHLSFILLVVILNVIQHLKNEVDQFICQTYILDKGI